MKNPAKWQKIGLSVLCVVLALILIFLIFATTYIHYLFSLMRPSDDQYFDDTLPPEVLATMTDEDYDPDYSGPVANPSDYTLPVLPSYSVPEAHLKNEVVNILLVGQDRREGESRQRSDVMMLLSFNTVKNTITMISFQRDTWVYIPGHGYAKMNAAYVYGGFKLLNETIAVNFGVHVDANVEVDFFGFTDIINLLGGVDIELTEKEAKHLNKTQGYEYDDHEKWELKAGWNHLTGEQALAYSRIRKIDSDFNRTQRQRTVIMALVENYKSKSLTEMLGLLDDILPMVTTNMTDHEIMTYAVGLFPMLSNAQINSQQIPANGMYIDEYLIGTGSSLIPDLPANRDILEKIMATD